MMTTNKDCIEAMADAIANAESKWIEEAEAALIAAAKVKEAS